MPDDDVMEKVAWSKSLGVCEPSALINTDLIAGQMDCVPLLA